jgi:hypothetical protein
MIGEVMYAVETPVLESVFVDLAPDAIDIRNIVRDDSIDTWYWSPLSYRELLEWMEETK